MIWIPLLAAPLALALVKLGSAVTLASVLKAALAVAIVLIAALTAALVWTVRRRGQIFP